MSTNHNVPALSGQGFAEAEFFHSCIQLLLGLFLFRL